MSALLQDVDPGGLLEYSVVYTDRALNHMSAGFQGVMRDISRILKETYNAHSAVVVPGSGTFGMEAVARQFAGDQHCMVIRNGWFSYRWSQIFDATQLPASTVVHKASRVASNEAVSEQVPQSQVPFAPMPIDEVVNSIKAEKPAVVFAPHVETSAGMILPDDYIKAVADAVHEVGGLMVLDCIASGTIWVDMKKTGVDILISAPQKGWSGPPCCGLVMLSELARLRIDDTQSNSFAVDLAKWLSIMETYESGAHAYHSTMPTESLRVFRDVMLETAEFGLQKVHECQQELGNKVRQLLSSYGFNSVAAPGFEAPGVIVCYTDNPAIQNGKVFMEAGMQVAAGVPLMCDEGDDFKTFRLGLFGLDKLKNIDRTVKSLDQTLATINAA